MIIRGWRIEGYGVFSDHGSPELARGVNVILGPNEAGKSTLLSFLRHILFGFPARRTSDEFIPALRGGALGGRVFLEDDNGGRWTVERFNDKKKTLALTTPEGHTVGEAELSALLGNLDGGAYRSVFGFDLADLARLDAMDNATVRGRLMSAGISGAGNSADKARGTLEASLGELLKPRAGGVLNELAERHRDLLKERDEAVVQLGNYAALAAGQAADEEDQAALAEKMDALRARVEQLKTFIRWKPTAVSLLDARQKLGETAGPALFPENGLARFEQHLGTIRGYKERIDAMRAALGRERDRLAKLATDDRWLTAAAALSALDRDAGEQRARLRELSELRLEIARARASFDASLASLGTAWNIGEVRSASVDPARTAKARNFEKRFSEAEVQLVICRRSTAEATGKLTGLTAAGEAGPAPKPDRRAGALLILASLAIVLLTYLLVPVNPLVGYLLGLALIVAGAVELRRSGSPRHDAELAARASDISYARVELSRSKELERQAEGEVAALSAEWAAVSAAWGLPGPPLAPEEAVELLNRLEAAKAALGRIDELDARVSRATSESAAWEKAAATLLAATPTPCAGESGDKLLEALRAASATAAAEVAREAEAKGVRDSIARMELDSAALAGSIKEEVELFEKLLGAAGADGEEEFRRMAALHARRRIIEEEVASSLRSLKSQFGDDFERSSATGELFSSNVESWTAELNAGQGELRELGARVTELNRKIGENGIRLRELERSTKVAEIESGIEAAKTEGAAAAREWLKTALAQELLLRALDKYARERQPGVLAEASRLFSLMTGGRYLRVVQPPDADGIRVERADGALCDVGALSRGTREELYLCIRLGLAADFAGRGASLPLLADDVFVNFDPVRAEAALAALCSFAAPRQGILFTCHPETAARVRAACPGASIFGLERGSGEIRRLDSL